MKREIWAVMLVCVLGCGCPKSPSPQGPAPAMEQISVARYQRVAVLPLVRITPSGQEARSPLTGEVFDTCPIAEHAEAALWGLLEETLDTRQDIMRVPVDQVRKAMDEMSLNESLNLRQDGQYQLAIARQVAADAALFGFVFCFKERAGTAYASPDPAAVGFNLVLVDVQSGELLWSGRYEEKQQSLSENVLEAGLFFKRGAKWVTAAELAQEGLQGLVPQIPH